VCYRCPTSVIDLAKALVPALEAAPEAERGSVDTIAEDALYSQVRAGDLVLCRMTAPLIRACVKLIAQRIPARVKGRDLGKQLVQTAKEALGRGRPFDELESALDEYLAERTGLLMQRKNTESRIQALCDRVDGVRACHEAFPDTQSLDAFARSIDSIFTDGASAVELSTVHRAKGLQAERVFILEPERLPLVWKGQHAWEYTQELNLRYVALTRAQKQLVICGTLAPASAVPKVAALMPESVGAA